MSKKKTPQVAQQFILPLEVSQEVWDAFVEMRKFIKHPMTEYAKALIVKKTMKISIETGEHPDAILERSIENSWQGVYPMPSPRGGNYGNRELQIREVFGSAYNKEQ